MYSHRAMVISKHSIITGCSHLATGMYFYRRGRRHVSYAYVSRRKSIEALSFSCLRVPSVSLRQLASIRPHTVSGGAPAFPLASARWSADLAGPLPTPTSNSTSAGSRAADIPPLAAPHRLDPPLALLGVAVCDAASWSPQRCGVASSAYLYAGTSAKNIPNRFVCAVPTHPEHISKSCTSKSCTECSESLFHRHGLQPGLKATLPSEVEPIALEAAGLDTTSSSQASTPCDLSSAGGVSIARRMLSILHLMHAKQTTFCICGFRKACPFSQLKNSFMRPHCSSTMSMTSSQVPQMVHSQRHIITVRDRHACL